MKALVAVKSVLDYNIKVRVRSDETGIDMANAKMSMNPFDEIAVEEAVRMKEAGVLNEVVAVSIGAVSSQDVLRSALALGADRAVLVETDMVLQSFHVAKLIKEVVVKEASQLVILGKQAIDDDAGQAGQMLAALLGWGQGTYASKVTCDGANVQVSRQVDGGLEIVKLKLPAVITTDLHLNTPRYATLPNIMRAKKKPLDMLSAASLGIDLSPRLKTLKISDPPQRKGGLLVPNVKILIEKLRNEAKVI